ncbi:Lrp/AsnC family transcriptional regulator [Reinekea blandensis]|uniref:Transcriptional regulator n=1 Tax=Reinekea blandensis MED297 TaxID=314283 RepID=A4BI62_9GAMM|nr:Lrp/AsnC family transcriptional regulator [Reinekea blandensis]EAR08205.1 Transcriptional regulator [Reinekea sp. MED297] [Reinekea blandensis MED297]
MDEFDRQILDALQNNSRLPHDELGDAIGLSASAVQRRIRRLKSQGMIQREQVIIDPQKVPGYLSAVIDVVLEAGGEQILDRFKVRLTDHPAVQQLFYVAGDIDFIVVLIARDMGEFDTLTRTLFMTPEVRKFSSHIVIDTVKASLGVPLSTRSV